MSEENLVVHAEPTKDFFITMLTKDIGLSRAILDLVDNCYDGALRLRRSKKFDDLEVRIEAHPESFTIRDNCGGLDSATARDYAFRFGRPETGPVIPHSIGQFGVGMKRALFKLGTKFKVESTSKSSHFVVEEDVDQWKQTDRWEFEFKDLQENVGPFPEAERGTTITVTGLHESVVKEFELENSLNTIRTEIAQAHQQALQDRMSMSFNGIPLVLNPMKLRSSDAFRAGYEELTLNDGLVKVKIYVGVSEPEPQEAGWYIYCNGRMILGADQTLNTGWGEGGGKLIPRFHNQFDLFRGLVFFDSNEARLLPWNTTKTGVDKESAAFKTVRSGMITLMRQVIDFLNALDRENSEPSKKKPLKKALEAAKLSPVEEVKHAKKFTWPEETKEEDQGAVRIVYVRGEDEFEIAKKTLRASSPREVGEKTFEYFYKRECE